MVNIANLIKGIDISSVQGTLDFSQIASAGYKFIVAKCGSGNDGIDPFYTSNISNATKAGLLTGCYHFVYPLPSETSQPLRDPIKQAQYHFNASNGASLVFCDLEWPEQQDWVKWGVTATSIKQWTLAYLQAYTNLNNGIKPLIYTYPYYAQALNLGASPEFLAYDLWIASYEPQPASISPWNQNWRMWQQGQIKLYNGAPVDIDYVQDLSLWQSVNSAPTAVIPQSAPEVDLNPVSVPTNSIPEPVVPVVNSPTSTPPITTTNAVNLVSNIWSIISNLFLKK